MLNPLWLLFSIVVWLNKIVYYIFCLLKNALNKTLSDPMQIQTKLKSDISSAKPMKEVAWKLHIIWLRSKQVLFSHCDASEK